jgi:hypothetical protein
MQIPLRHCGKRGPHTADALAAMLSRCAEPLPELHQVQNFGAELDRHASPQPARHSQMRRRFAAHCVYSRMLNGRA